MTEDTADKVATLKECLYSTINRAKTALILIDANPDLLPTCLEDLFAGCQILLDEHCVKAR
uniref:Uncharacterized protein n=1 Tax=viral metagenome TaxID=1070528 RepID=A0A6M3IWU4_9ZZZZ